MRMSAVVYPADEAEVAAIVTDAAARREPLLIQGNGSKLGMLRPVQAARTLSTRHLSGITLYAPRELVISARAGTPIAEIEAALAEHGQHLIAEPPELGALLGSDAPQTLGGMVATNLSGPRRVAWGAMRDHVIGVRAVNGSGEVIRSGGRVLKNVTGLDLCKLLTGSHGTLGVLTEITLKVLPAPQDTASLAILGLTAEQGVAAMSAALGSPYGVSAAAWLPPDMKDGLSPLSGASVALIRIEDFAKSVVYRVGRLQQDLASFGKATILDAETSRRTWRAIRDATVLRHSVEEPLWRVSVRPSRGATALAKAEAAGARGFLDWGGGLIWLAGPATEATHAAVTAAATAAGGIWTLMRAPDSLRASVDVVPREASALAAITRRVKSAMDPQGILNPGRLYAGL
jgi:glycolate oxidase FAD binding subunit